MHRRHSYFWGLLVPALGLVSLTVVLSLVAGTSETAAETTADICGAIAADAVWFRAESPYVVSCETTLETGVRLDIEPGVEIRFEPGAALLVLGTLAATGTPTRPITFTSGLAAPARGDWNGLRFEAGSSASELRWCTIEYATTGISVYATGGHVVSPTFADCIVRENALIGIQVEARAQLCSGGTASASIARCTIESNTDAGIEVCGRGDTNMCTTPQYGVAGGTLLNSTIRDNGTGVRILSRTGNHSRATVNTLVDGNQIVDNVGTGIEMWGNDLVQATIQNNLIRGNGAAGIEWTEELASDPYLVNNTIVANGQDGIAYSSTVFGNTLIENNILAANGGYGLSCLSGAAPKILTNDVWDNVEGTYGSCSPGQSDLATDPQFVDAASGDFHLELGSSCIDAGTGADAPAADLEGVSRPQGEGVDLGAYEFWSPGIWVGQDAAEIGEGTDFAFGPVQVGSGHVASFAIGNVGNRALRVEAIDVQPAEHFAATVAGGLPLTIGAGLSDTFDLLFAPGATGEHTATVSIASNDPEDNPYRFTASGLGAQSVTHLSISGPETGLLHHTYVFTAAVWPLTATQPITYLWQFAGQPPVVSSSGLSEPVSFAWEAPGPHVLTATVENILNRLTATHAISLYTAVESDFVAAPTRGRAPLRVAFANRSQGDYVDSWWDLGDGTVSTLESPVHTYTVPGPYAVTLRVSGPGGSDTAVKGAYIIVERYRIHLPLLVRTA